MSKIKIQHGLLQSLDEIKDDGAIYFAQDSNYPNNGKLYYDTPINDDNSNQISTRIDVSGAGYTFSNGAEIFNDYRTSTNLQGNVATGEYSHAEGQNTAAQGDYSHSEGKSTTASGQASHTEGYNTKTNNRYSHAEGEGSKASGRASHAEGGSIANGDYSHSEGSMTIADGNFSHAEGYNSVAVGSSSHAEGASSTKVQTVISNISSATNDQILEKWGEGDNQYLFSVARGERSHVEGYNNLALGNDSHAEGLKTQATGTASHSEGHLTKASGNYSHSEGWSLTDSLSDEINALINAMRLADEECINIINNELSTPEQEEAAKEKVLEAANALKAKWESTPFSAAVGVASHVEGVNCLATTRQAHAEGYQTAALGWESHAEGSNTQATNGQAHAEGCGTIASAFQAHAEGYFTEASGNNSHAEGNGTKATASSAHSEGHMTLALGQYSHAEGQGELKQSEAPEGALDNLKEKLAQEQLGKSYTELSAMEKSIIDILAKVEFLILYPSIATHKAAGIASHVEGKNNIAYGDYSHAEGAECVAGVSDRGDVEDQGQSAHAEGNQCQATGYGSHAEGYQTLASANEAHAEGSGTKAIANHAHAEGYKTFAAGIRSHAEGSATAALEQGAHSEGSSSYSAEVYAYNEDGTLKSDEDIIAAFGTTRFTLAKGVGAHAEGLNTLAIGQSAHSEGNNTIAFGKNTHAEGNGTQATAQEAHAEGNTTQATSNQAHAEGYLTKATNVRAHAEGQETTASGSHSHAEGYKTLASHSEAHAEGSNTQAIAGQAHAEGSYTTASAGQAHAEGYYTIASGNNSHAEGNGSQATNSSAHAEGHGTIASGQHSHAEGKLTKASGTQSHARGVSCEARGNYSTAEGYGSIVLANCECGHAGGMYSIAKTHQFAFGHYGKEMAGSNSTNQGSSNYLVVIGNGTSTSARSNAFTVAANGRVNAASTYTANNADFAEYFEWEDGNLNNEDRRGLFVTLNGDKIKIANNKDSYILGAITSTEAFIGNAYDDDWRGRYLTDIFGQKLYQEVEVFDEETKDSENPVVIGTTKQFIPNPEFDNNQIYISRENRKEWAPVGLCGQVVLIDDGSCEINGYCRPSATGIATKFSIEDIEENTPEFMKEFYLQQKGYRVIERLDDTHIKIIIK